MGHPPTASMSRAKNQRLGYLTLPPDGGVRGSTDRTGFVRAVDAQCSPRALW